MLTMKKVMYLLLVLGGTAACSNELKGSLSVDGEPFELKSCRSGQIYGFAGVEVVGKNGGKLRIAQAPTGEGVAFYIPPGAATGEEIGVCGSFKVSTQNSTINDVKNVEGEAALDCEGAGHTIKGSFSYSNCH